MSSNEFEATSAEPDSQTPAPGFVISGTTGGGTFTPQPAPNDNDPDAGDEAENVLESVAQPAKVMRIGSMVKQLLDEVRNAPLDDAGRARLAEIHARSITELESGLAPHLVAELRRITLPLADNDDTPPSDAELRIAQAQLVGWLEGLFHGIQAAVFQQQALSEAARRALPAGRPTGGGDTPGRGAATGTGQYL